MRRVALLVAVLAGACDRFVDLSPPPDAASIKDGRGLHDGVHSDAPGNLGIDASVD